jgi:hypothetical protein
MNATLFAILYDLLFAVAVVALVRSFRRTPVKTWVFCVGAFGGSAVLWVLMLAALVLVIGPNIELTNEGHALGNFLTPYLVIGAGVILFAPVLAYLLRTPNSAPHRDGREATHSGQQSRAPARGRGR